MKYEERWDLLRLSGLHSGTPIKIFNLINKYDLTCNITRQTGAGAYLVNRKAAKCMVKYLLPMKLPYDHAFDTEWNFHIRTMFVTPPTSKSKEWI
jgi:glycosyl transferase family 25